MCMCDTLWQEDGGKTLESPAARMSERSLVATSLRLLGVEDVPAGKHVRAHHEYRRRVGAVPVTQLLRRPTSEALCAAVHFCLWRLDARRAQTTFRHCYPPQAPAHSRELKQLLAAWLQELERDARIPRRGCAVVSVLVSPTPAKALTLLGTLSRHVLAVVAERECGIVENGAVAVLPPAVQQQRLVTLAQLFVAERRRFSRFSERISRSLAALAQEHAALVQERAALEQELSECDASDVADLSAVSIVGLMEPLWARLEALKETTDRLLDAVATRGRQKQEKCVASGIDDVSLVAVCERRGLMRDAVIDTARDGCFDAGALVGVCGRVADALPTVTEDLVQRMAHAAVEWRALAEEKEAALQCARAEAAQDAREVGALAQSTVALESALLPSSAEASSRAELTQHSYDGIAFVPVDPASQQQSLSRCIMAMAVAAGHSATEPSSKRRCRDGDSFLPECYSTRKERDVEVRGLAPPPVHN